MSKTALLVIDMQKGLFGTPRYDSENVILRINDLIGACRKKGHPVIFIQHDGVGDALIPQTPGWEILGELDRVATDLVVRKTACDAFFRTDLMDVLVGFGVERLVVTGCATDFCVDTTLRTAALSFFVLVAKDAHTTADRSHLSAKAIIRHHNFMWENLILPDTSVLVADTNRLIPML